MDMTLTRDMFRSDGIFGTLKSDDGSSFSCITLEHAYEMTPNIFSPKIPTGQYTCKRRMSPHFGFEVFELLNVPNCEYIEIHPGNYNEQSEGCIMVGKALGWKLGGQIRMITFSDQTFQALMKLQEGIDEFQLTVR